jgi:type I restriction enzyme S subunit
MQVVIAYYKDLTRWDVKYFFTQDLFGDHFVLLGSLIKRYKKLVNSNKDNISLITLSNAGQTKLRKEVSVKEVKGKLFSAKPGMLVYSKIAFADGSVGILPDLKNIALSSEFPVYEIDKNKVNEIYLWLYLISENTKKQSRILQVGQGRKRVYENDFENIKIYLPPLKIQEKIVARWHEAQKEAQELNKKAEEKEKAIDDYILRELGVVRKEYEKKKGVFVAWFKDLERWGVNFNSYDWNLDNLFESKKYKTEHLNRVAIINKTYQFSKEDLQKEVSFVPMESVSDIEGEIKTSENRKLDEIKNGFTRFVEGDIIFAKITPCMENGKCAIAKKLKNGLGIGSTEFHVLTPNKSLIDTKYLWTFLRLKTFRKSAERFFIGSAGQQRVPVNFLEEIKIPLPPLSKQKEIAEKVETIRAEIAEIKNKASEILETTQKEIGKMLKT